MTGWKCHPDRALAADLHSSAVIATAKALFTRLDEAACSPRRRGHETGGTARMAGPGDVGYRRAPRYQSAPNYAPERRS
jgi:hypothetical protein